MKPTLPARGRNVAVAALIAVSLGVLLAAADAVAASASTGGFSFTPPTVATPPARAALHPDRRTATPPSGAPAGVVRAVAAANRITRKPYKWGGGHGRWRDSGYDCSGAVSYVLHAAGLLQTARDSTGLMSFGARGPGRWITVYTHRDHAYMVIGGLRFDTSGRGDRGPRWRPEPRSADGYVARHPAGL